MANVTNTFIKSKMNKDLDDRLLSNGEYRDAQNVNVSRSEGDDVGALENVLGNKLLNTFGTTYNRSEIIGYLEDPGTNFLFLFITNYTDISSDELSHVAPYGAVCQLLRLPLEPTSSSYLIPRILIQGRFLNFSKTHPIYSVNIVEDLLFWTDDRNQPRKLNIALEGSNVYEEFNKEDQISVAKYYPFKVPYLYESTSVAILASDVAYPGRYFLNVADAIKLRAGDILKIPYERILTGSNGSIEIFYPVQIAEINYDNTGFPGAEITLNIEISLLIYSTIVTFLRPSSKRVTPEYLPEFNSGAFVSQRTIPGATPFFRVKLKGWWSRNNLVGKNTKVIGNFANATEILTTGSQIDISGEPNQAEVPVNQLLSPVPTAGDLIAFRQPNPEYTDTWPGDSELLSDKFVRFAYRFKFGDGEYSLISPFTQPAFIPKQDGYFNTFVKQKNKIPGVSGNFNTYRSDLEETQASTIVSFFENKVQDVTINIDTEFKVNELRKELNVSEIDILYKESDGLAIQVLETLSVTDPSLKANDTFTLEYKYQSKKPFKTLPAREISRVYDKVPIRAKSQSITGSRVVYGNFLDKHTPPQNLNFGVSISDKSRPSSGVDRSATASPAIPAGAISNLNFSTISYPNHSVKQNRNYQVGIVLSDRYGRQSDVVLSSVKAFQFKQTGGTEVFGGSSIFHPFKKAGATYEDQGNGTGEFGQNDVINGTSAMPFSWFGDSIKILFIDKIPETVAYADGYPGLYKDGEYKAIANPGGPGTTAKILVLSSLDSYFENGIKYPLYISVGDILTDPSQESLVVSITNIDVSTKTLTLSKSVTIGANATVNISGTPNKLGWYSYKVVVKQQKQDYYNAYLPLIVNDVPGGIDSNSVTQAYTTLLSDNINKIPADLGEVQPEQTQFRTSDELLYPRVLTSNHSTSYVQASATPSPADIYVQGAFGFQSSLDDKYFVVDTIGKAVDLGVNTNDITATPPEVITTAPGIYDAKSNPSIGRISTLSTQAGYSSKSSLANYPGPSSTPVTRLLGLSQAISVLEIDPPESRIDIYWETSTTGLISELNLDIDNGVTTVEVLPTPPVGGEG